MTDDKRKAERHFNWEALTEAVERIKPELIAASEATHNYGADNAPDDRDFDRTVALGHLVDSIAGREILARPWGQGSSPVPGTAPRLRRNHSSPEIGGSEL